MNGHVRLPFVSNREKEGEKSISPCGFSSSERVTMDEKFAIKFSLNRKTLLTELLLNNRLIFLSSNF